MDLKTHAKKLKIALLLAALMLCFAVFPALPYAFYLLLKWVVCGAAVYGGLEFQGRPAAGPAFLAPGSPGPLDAACLAASRSRDSCLFSDPFQEVLNR